MMMFTMHNLNTDCFKAKFCSVLNCSRRAYRLNWAKSIFSRNSSYEGWSFFFNALFSSSFTYSPLARSLSLALSWSLPFAHALPPFPSLSSSRVFLAFSFSLDPIKLIEIILSSAQLTAIHLLFGIVSSLNQETYFLINIFDLSIWFLCHLKYSQLFLSHLLLFVLPFSSSRSCLNRLLFDQAFIIRSNSIRQRIASCHNILVHTIYFYSRIQTSSFPTNVISTDRPLLLSE